MGNRNFHTLQVAPTEWMEDNIIMKYINRILKENLKTKNIIFKNERVNLF